MIIPIHKILHSSSCDIILAEQEILQQVAAEENYTPIRVTFFTRLVEPKEYVEQRERIKLLCHDIFADSAPVTALVAQPPLEGSLLAEVTYVRDFNHIEYHNDYIILNSNHIYTGGLFSTVGNSIEEQSDDIFAHLSDILSGEGFTISDIVRQCNYIEHITRISLQGQNYQQFNDSRSRFYALTTWQNGYPAATGIGADGGGVVIVVDAIRNSASCSRMLNNPLQQSAHTYSQQVLIEGRTSSKSTPKFERGRWVGDELSGMIYISGTAAIRGEESLHVNEVQQCIMTLENIKHLISTENLLHHDVKCVRSYNYELLRIYVKNRNEWPQIKHWLQENCECRNIVPVAADICRTELLIEIEGIAKTTT